jgi:hypothetical protein
MPRKVNFLAPARPRGNSVETEETGIVTLVRGARYEGPYFLSILSTSVFLTWVIFFLFFLHLLSSRKFLSNKHRLLIQIQSKMLCLDMDFALQFQLCSLCFQWLLLLVRFGCGSRQAPLNAPCSQPPSFMTDPSAKYLVPRPCGRPSNHSPEYLSAKKDEGRND